MSTTRNRNDFEDFYGRIISQYDPRTQTVVHKYQFGNFIGKGGFAQVYVCDCLDEKKRYAMKIVKKSSLLKDKAKEKLLQEIDIHKSLNHQYIVKFYRHFEDENYHYILLELCTNKSMTQLLKTRKRLTEPEVQYFALQLISALEYLHSNYIIHRDIKLANLLLDGDLNIKLADFGLAAKLCSNDDRKMTMCGTPNYIAPEILANKEHRSYSYEVDIWSFGVVIYTLLIGKPPFETNDIKDTYQRIREVNFHFPDADILIGDNARHFIRALLHEDPTQRLTLKEMREHPFFTASPAPPPSVLPLTVLSQPLYLPAPTPTLPTPVIQRKKLFTNFQEQETEHNPRATTTGHISNQVQIHTKDNMTTANRNMINANANNRGNHIAIERTDSVPVLKSSVNKALEAVKMANNQIDAKSNNSDCFTPDYMYSLPLYKAIYKALTSLLEDYTQASKTPAPSSIPWIVEVFDYTNMFGTGYLYEDNSVGVFFNDATTIFYNTHSKIFSYREAVYSATYVLGTPLPTPIQGTLESYPPSLYKKVSLLKYFRQYLLEQKSKHNEDPHPNVMTRPLVNNPPFVIAWHLTEYSHLFIFSDGSLQMILFGGTSVYVNILKNTVVYFDKNRTYSTISLSTACMGYKPDLIRRLNYVRSMLEGAAVEDN